MSVILSFGKPVRVLAKPGLYFKLPYPINSVAEFDSRLKLLQPRPSEFLTADKKNLILENSICYKIVDPVLLMKTVRDQKGLEVRLSDLLASHTGLLLGVRELSDIVNVDTTRIKFRLINEQLTELVRGDAGRGTRNGRILCPSADRLEHKTRSCVAWWPRPHTRRQAA